MRMLCCGRSNHEIGRELFISTATVRKHLDHIYAHFGVRSRGQAIARVLR